jgi:hypothetical protein
MQDRTGDGQDEQKKDEAADQKEQEVLYLQSSPAFLQRLEEKNHRRPFAAAKALAIDQVDEDRHTDESAKPKQT